MQNIRAEVLGKIEGRAEIHLPPDHFFKFKDHAAEAKHAWCASRLKLHEEINIAVGAEVVAEHAAEDREPSYPVAGAELRELIFGKCDAVQNHGGLIVVPQ